MARADSRDEGLQRLREMWFEPGDSATNTNARFRREDGSKLGDARKYSPLGRSFLQERKPSPIAFAKRAQAKPTANTAFKHLGKADHYSNLLEKGQYNSNLFSRLTEGRRRLQQKFREYLETASQKERKGELPVELVKTIWGSTRPRRGSSKQDDAATDDLIRKLRRKKKQEDEKIAECLMDVLMRSWSYFEHSHSNVKSVGNHVHAKYCEGAFGHFLLPDGTQIHGSYTISLRRLISELRTLLLRLKGKLIHTDYKAVPIWRPPRLEEVREFIPPPHKPLPSLYPIEGLLPVPKEEIPANSALPRLSTPEPHPHPPYVAPTLLKAPLLNLPTLRDYSQEEKNVDYSIYKELPPPTFVAPDQLPLPLWIEPEEQPLPPEPVKKEAEILPEPILEILPPYVPPVAELRPCEASYYPVVNDQVSICDGLCGGSRSKAAGEVGHCQALPTAPVPIPSAPVREIIPDPQFEPPAEEPIPAFKAPPLKLEPKYVGPPKPDLPEWVPPPSPDPIGYLAGQKPVFLVDCSNTMTGERMKVAQEAIRSVFAKGGQAEVAATHFDIIMYSFDAWSYGALEEERQYKLTGGPVRHWVKNLEVMQPKTPENVEKTLTWMMKWRTGGRTNLLKALEVALQRHSADCIYLLTDGKPERPVIVMNALKKWKKERGRLTPLYPVGLAPSKRGAHFMKNFADLTGGQFRQLDLKWQSKPHSAEGVALKDVNWSRLAIEQKQRRNLKAGIVESMDIVLQGVKAQFEAERATPRSKMYFVEEEKAKREHTTLLNAIREENMKNMAESQKAYDQRVAEIKGRNKQRLDHAWKIWAADLQRVRDINVQSDKLYAEWETIVANIEDIRTKAREDARKQFAEDIKEVERNNASMLVRSKAQYEAEVRHLHEKNDLLIRSAKIKQEEIIAQTEMANRAMWTDFEERCKEIRAGNARVLEKARADFAGACDAIKKENDRTMTEAEQEFSRRSEEINMENLRRKIGYNAKLEEFRLKKEAAIKFHQEQVAALIAEHDATLARLGTINNQTEEQAKLAWRESCKAIDEDNKRAAEADRRQWEDATRIILEEKEQLEKKRVALRERTEEVERINEEIKKKKKEVWKEACARIEGQYEEEAANMKVEHEKFVKELTLKNARFMEDAWAAHSARLAAVEAYNDTIRPYVEASILVQKEISRIQAFLKYIVSKSDVPIPNFTSKRRPTLEQCLDILAAQDKPCHPNIIMEALQIAFADDIKAGTFPEKPPAGKVTKNHPSSTASTAGSKPDAKFSGMIPISPTRVTAHSCVSGKAGEPKSKDFAAMVANRQQEISAMIAPMLKAKE